jgi:alpha-glucosidase
MLNLYKQALGLRRRLPALGAGSGRDVTWLDLGDDVAGFSREPGFVCVVNTGSTPVPLPRGRLVLASNTAVRDQLPPDTAAWLTTS